MDNVTGMPRPGVNYSQTVGVQCEECDGEIFQPAFMIRKVSALVSPTGKETMLPVQLFSCVACNHVNKDMLPVE
jgi:hypothetical protein